MSKGKILILGSSATQIEVHGGYGPTGQYLNELVVPAMAFIDAGYEVVLATPSGKQPHIDAPSDSPAHFGGDQQAYQKAKDFFANNPAMTNVRTIHSVAEEGVEGYAGVFAPGGQGPVVDLMQDPDVGRILPHFHSTGKPSGFLCHGPITIAAAMPKAKEFRAAMVAGDKQKAAELAKGWPYAGYHMTVFSATEEKVIEDQILHDKLFFNMPDALTIAGATVTTTPVDFDPYVVVDRELITGQNPRSDHQIAAKLIEALDRKAGTRAA
ncbi:MAG: type 1 glutamine amidotransferase domain-containing protein [Rhizobiaceae bacterium]|nr:type 1 glutamine amidotransferase domain-containing protein [Rhizobiaceae bacterium]